MTTDEVMAAALAKIDQTFNRDYLAAKEREASDPILARLNTMFVELDRPITASGWEGFAQVVEGIADSSRNWRLHRVIALQLARKLQIARKPYAFEAWMTKAAERRRNEMRYRYREASELALGGVDRALADMAQPLMAAE